jgi:hypothetical protein
MDGIKNDGPDVSGPANNPSESEGQKNPGDGGPTPDLKKKTNITGGGHDWDKEPKGTSR